MCNEMENQITDYFYAVGYISCYHLEYLKRKELILYENGVLFSDSH